MAVPVLTPARLRVLASVAARHVKRDRWGGDVHAAVRGKDCCELRDYQSVKQQVTWLEANGLICPDESTVTYGWQWTPTPAGWSALGRTPF